MPARRAVEFIAAEPIAEIRVSDAMTISELARALGVRTSTLRHWETEHLLAPTRDRTARRYSPEDVRDARIVHQMRLAGYRVPDLRSLMPRLRVGRDIETLAEGLAARDRILDGRSQAMLEAAAALSALLKSSGAVMPTDSAVAPVGKADDDRRASAATEAVPS